MTVIRSTTARQTATIQQLDEAGYVMAKALFDLRTQADDLIVVVSALQPSATLGQVVIAAGDIDADVQDDLLTQLLAVRDTAHDALAKGKAILNS